MVTKKRRRSQLARASARRQAERRAVRDARRRRARRVVTVVVVVVLLVVLAVWVATHRGDSGATAVRSFDYAARVDPMDRHPRSMTPTHEGAR